MTEKPAPQPSTSTPNNATTTTAQASTATAPGTAPSTTSGQNNQPTTSTSTGAAPTTTTATAPGPNTNRGLPYYEKLRRELRDTLQRKRMMDKSMAQLEDQIYRFEQSYLEETTAGNIIKGFDNYIKGSSSTTGFSAGGLSSLGIAGGPGTRRKAAVADSERVFSRSSISYLRDSPTPTSTQTTPSHAPTPSSTHNGASGRPNGDNFAAGGGSGAGSTKGGNSSKNKKKAASSAAAGRNGTGDEDDEEKQPVKRLKITYSRE